MSKKVFLILFAAACACACAAEPGAGSSSNAPTASQATAEHERSEKVRAACIDGRRYVAGRVLQVTQEGLVIDSGYSKLLEAPFNKSWVVSGTAVIERDAHAVEENKPDAVCVGLVFLANTPKRQPVKPYDYVVIHAYPSGKYIYKPVPGVAKPIRYFSASLERAVQKQVAEGQK
jgi:hypothetical protein